MSSFSIVGAAIMLLWLEFWSGITACLILVFFGLLLPKYSKTNDLLYLKLNDRLEKEVNVIEQKSNYYLNKHYDWLAYLDVYKRQVQPSPRRMTFVRHGTAKDHKGKKG